MPAKSFTWRVLDPHDTTLLRACAELVSQHSWGPDYPFHPWGEIQHGEFHAAVFDGDTPIGYACVGRNASPDGEGNGDLWLADGVVLPAYRRFGLGIKLYAQCLDYMRTQPGRMFTCTSVPKVARVLQRGGWQLARETRDEEGNRCLVLEHCRT